jgi:hypothetical protein
MSATPPPTPSPRQSREDREYILANLPEGTQRVQVINDQGAQQYKKPDDVNVDKDEIVISKDGTPVVMKGKPGRKPKTQLNPVTPQIAQVSQARDDHFENDSLLKGVRAEALADSVMDDILKGMAEEAAALEFERMEAERHGQETSNISVKRARVLKSMGDLGIKRKLLLDGGLINLDSPIFETLFLLILETFKESMKDAGVRAEQVEQTFSHLQKSLDNSWREEAKARMKEKMN